MLLDDGTAVFPEPVLVGRNEERLRDIAERHSIQRWTTNLDDVLGDPGIDIYFDAQVTTAREASLRQAIAAGKHVYTEKPIAESLSGALDLARAARQAGITHGVVQDKLFLPGVIKLRRLIKEGLFRPRPVDTARIRLLGVRGRRPRLAAPIVELPQGGGWRDRPRHVPALAIPA